MARTSIFVVFSCAAGAILGAQPAFQHLLEDLQSPREGTRAKAARALPASGYPEAAAALAPLVADPANTVQLEAIDGLLTLAFAPPPAAELAKPFKVTAGTLAWSVFDAGPLAVLPRAWPAQVRANLVTALRDDDPQVRGAAAGALAVLASASAPAWSADDRAGLIPDVIAALRTPDPYTRQSAARAVGAIFTPAVGAAPPVAVGDALIAALNDTDPVVRVAATEALGWIRDPRAEQALKDRLAYYRKGPEAEASLHALARIAGATSATIFREALGSRETPFRVIAAEGLGRLRDRREIAALTARSQEERDEAVHIATAFAFFLLGERSNLERMVTALARPEFGRQARAYLTELGPAVAPDLEAWLRTGDPLVRRAVVEVLGLTGYAASEVVLQPLARSDADPAVAAAARQAVVRLRALPAGVRTR